MWRPAGVDSTAQGCLTGGWPQMLLCDTGLCTFICKVSLNIYENVSSIKQILAI